MQTISRQWTTDESLATDINGAEETNIEADDYQSAVQASLINI